MFRTRCLSLSFAIVYLMTAMMLLWGLFCKGRHDEQELLWRVFSDLQYFITAVLIFLMLININLDFKLRLQILANGSISFIAIDSKGGEVFRIKMKQLPKRKGMEDLTQDELTE